MRRKRSTACRGGRNCRHVKEVVTGAYVNPCLLSEELRRGLAELTPAQRRKIEQVRRVVFRRQS
jgi:hypothetical protein